MFKSMHSDFEIQDCGLFIKRYRLASNGSCRENKPDCAVDRSSVRSLTLKGDLINVRPPKPRSSVLSSCGTIKIPHCWKPIDAYGLILQPFTAMRLLLISKILSSKTANEKNNRIVYLIPQNKFIIESAVTVFFYCFYPSFSFVSCIIGQTAMFGETSRWIYLHVILTWLRRLLKLR